MIKVYIEKKLGIKSFEPLKEIKMETNLTPSVKSGLDEIPREKLEEILENNTEAYDYYVLRLFKLWLGDRDQEGNLWLPAPLVLVEGYSLDKRGYCLGHGYIMDIETLYPLGVISALEEIKTREPRYSFQYGFAEGVKVSSAKWRKYITLYTPLTMEYIEEGHPLHYPEGSYTLISAKHDVINFEEVLDKFETLNGGDDIHVLLYPNLVAVATNGIAGNPTYLFRVT